MKLPFKPESDSDLKKRIPAALTPLIDPEHCLATGQYPSSNRRHVLDFEDGMRLIVSRDSVKIGGANQAVHVSGSIEPESPLHSFLPRGINAYPQLCKTIAARIEAMLDMKNVSTIPTVITPTGKIPHWYLPCIEFTDTH